MNRYSDMTIWELCEERNAIETELATRHSSREPSAAPQENLKGSEAPHTAPSHRPDAPPAVAAPDVAEMVKRLNDISEGRESRIAHIFKDCRKAAALLARLWQERPAIHIDHKRIENVTVSGAYISPPVPGASDE